MEPTGRRAGRHGLGDRLKRRHRDPRPQNGAGRHGPRGRCRTPGRTRRGPRPPPLTRVRPRVAPWDEPLQQLRHQLLDHLHPRRPGEFLVGPGHRGTDGHHARLGDRGILRPTGRYGNGGDLLGVSHRRRRIPPPVACTTGRRSWRGATMPDGRGSPAISTWSARSGSSPASTTAWPSSSATSQV